MQVADVASLSVAIVALILAYVALRRSDRNASAATLITLNEAFTAAWQRYLAVGADQDFEMANLANLIEIGCAAHDDGSIHGASRKILARYLESILALIEETPEARRRLHALREDDDNFEHIVSFLKQRRSILKTTSSMGIDTASQPGTAAQSTPANTP